MSLFISSITGRILDDGSTPAETIELQGVTAGQVATILTQYTPLETNTANIGANAAALAALQTQVAALPALPDLAPYALAADLAAAEGSIAANLSSLTALSASLTTGLAGKANQSALDALQLEVATKSTPASVDTKLQAFSNTAAMNSAIASANNATLASVASNYALRTVTDQLALDLAAKQSGLDVDTKIANALLDRPSTTDLTAAVNLKTAPADLLIRKLQLHCCPTYTDTTGVNSLLAVRDAQITAADAAIAACRLRVIRRRPKSHRRSQRHCCRTPRKRSWTPPSCCGTPASTVTTPRSWPCSLPGPSRAPATSRLQRPRCRAPSMPSSRN